jgi:hypothetical protein
MPITELLPVLQKLPKVDKLRLIQFLVFELAKDEGINLFVSGQSYPIWTPHDAFDAANILLNALQEDTVVAHVSS